MVVTVHFNINSWQKKTYLISGKNIIEYLAEKLDKTRCKLNAFFFSIVRRQIDMKFHDFTMMWYCWTHQNNWMFNAISFVIKLFYLVHAYFCRKFARRALLVKIFTDKWQYVHEIFIRVQYDSIVSPFILVLYLLFAFKPCNYIERIRMYSYQVAIEIH